MSNQEGVKETKQNHTDSLMDTKGEPILKGWRGGASDVFRIIHIAGFAMFFGSILTSTLISLSTSVTSNPQAVAFAWNAIGQTAMTLTTPGMILTVLSGITLLIVQRRNLREQIWLLAKIILTIAIFLNAVLLITPAEEQLIAYAADLPMTITAFTEVASQQQIYGAINLVMILIVFILGVVKRPKRLSTNGV